MIDRADMADMADRADMADMADRADRADKYNFFPWKVVFGCQFLDPGLWHCPNSTLCSGYK